MINLYIFSYLWHPECASFFVSFMWGVHIRVPRRENKRQGALCENSKAGLRQENTPFGMLLERRIGRNYPLQFNSY